MKAMLVGAGFLLLLASGAAAKTDIAKLLAPTDKMVLHGKDVAQTDVYEWERDGVRYNAWPGDGNTPPYDAALLKLRVFSFPTGMIRELFYQKGTRTPPHVSAEDIVMYGISGKRVQIVNDSSHELDPGDVSFHPFGVNHHSESIVAGTQLEFAFPGKLGPGPQAIWISGKDTPEIQAAAWLRDGKQVTAHGDDLKNVPAGASRYSAKIFKFPTVALIEIHLPKGVVTFQHSDDVAGLVYVVKGRLKVHVGAVDDEVTAGDAVYEPAGIAYRFEAIDDVVLAKVSPPAGTSAGR
jgi:quercetin dioxygenase-like cupin family protein